MKYEFLWSKNDQIAKKAQGMIDFLLTWLTQSIRINYVDSRITLWHLPYLDVHSNQLKGKSLTKLLIFLCKCKQQWSIDSRNHWKLPSLGTLAFQGLKADYLFIAGLEMPLKADHLGVPHCIARKYPNITRKVYIVKENCTWNFG